MIDASSVLAGPLACQILGDFGADVIKVEHPRQGDSIRQHGHSKDGKSLWWKSIARNKRCVGLDLGDPDGAALFLRLAAEADVVVENFRPGTLERWGIGYDRMRALNPRLVLVRVTGFGQEGPYAGRPGFGTLAEAMSGFAMSNGEPDGPPLLPPFGLADGICAMAAVAAAVMGLYHRDTRSGQGQQADLSILEPIVMALGVASTAYDQLGVVPSRTGNRSTHNAPRNVYRTRDDRWVAVSASTTAIARRVMELVGRSDLVAEPWFDSSAERARHPEVDRCVEDWVRARDLDDVVRGFEQAQAAIAPVYDIAGLMSDPHIVARDVFPSVADPDLGAVRMQNVLFRLSETPGSIRWTGRDLGADTDEILLKELGVTPECLQELRARGVVA